MGPPNSVAIASPIPTHYFGDAYGALAVFPSSFQFHGLLQPFIPTAHTDYDSSGRTLRPWPVVTNPTPTPPVTATPIVGNIRTIINNLPHLPAIENPVSWWRRQLPGIPERGM